MAILLKQIVPYTQHLMGGAAGIIFTASMYSHTLGLNRYRRVIEQHKDGEPQPLDEKTATMAEELLISLPLSVEEESGIDFFTVYGQETCHRGSCKLRTGAVIGLPGTFVYESENQVQTNNIQLNNAPVNWDSRGGKLLLKSIVFSNNAKRFAILRELEYVNTYHVWSEAGLKSTFFLTAYMVGFALTSLFQLKKTMKRWGRGGLYGFIGFTAACLYVLMDDTYYCHRDNAVDKRIAKRGKDFIEGGAEFYTKLLQRNMALRLLMGSEGERLYTTYGNEVCTWRRPRAMLTERRDYFTKCMNDLKETKTQEEQPQFE